MAGGPTRRLGLLVVSAAVCAASHAAAQVSGSVGVISDYRLRGLSLTDGRSAVTATLAYDHAGGFYAGGALVGHDPANVGPRLLGHLAYAGFAGRIAGGPSWDAGVSRVDLRPYFDREYDLSYTEAYVGLAHRGISGRVSVAPDYPRHGVATVYGEINGSVRPREAWRLSGHAGAQFRSGGYDRRDGSRERYDVTLGVARELPRGELSLTWTKVFNRSPGSRPLTRAGVQAGAAWFF